VTPARRPGPARRSVLAGGAAALLGGASDAAAAPAWASLEARVGGRLGVFGVNSGNGRTFGWRADERFPMCSTFKGLLAGAVLARVDARRERLDREVQLSPADMVAHAPVTSRYLAAGAVRVETLCQAIVEVSDNPGANLLLKTLGGPRGFTRHIRAQGDRATRLDRYETELNSAIPGDPRDTTTPAAMVGSYRRLGEKRRGDQRGRAVERDGAPLPGAQHRRASSQAGSAPMWCRMSAAPAARSAAGEPCPAPSAPPGL